MNVSGLAAGLCPGALLVANVTVGAGLYRLGAVVAAAVAVLCGLLVLAGLVSAVGPAVEQPAQDAI